MAVKDCPDRRQLAAYARGELPAIDAQLIRLHEASCADCQATLQSLGARPVAIPIAVAPGQDPQWPPGYVAAKMKPSASPSAASDSKRARLTASEAAVLARLQGYEVQKKLGQGGMGTVFLARQVKLNRPVAIKVLPESCIEDQKALARFEREMKAVGRLNHPHIVQAYDAGEVNQVPYLVMEYVDGLSLGELTQRVGPLPVAEACELIRQAALALQFALENGLVHRDVKPSNLMLSRRGQVKVLDLGLARYREEAVAGAEMTYEGDTMGTPDYMAPEQAKDSRDVDIRADIYSLGCTLYALLAGHPPFSGEKYTGRIPKIMAHLREPIPPLVQLRGDVPPVLAAVLDRMLAKHRDRRYQTPSQVADAVGALAASANLTDLLARAEGRPATGASQRPSTTSAQCGPALVETHSEDGAPVPPPPAVSVVPIPARDEEPEPIAGVLAEIHARSVLERHPTRRKVDWSAARVQSLLRRVPRSAWIGGACAAAIVLLGVILYVTTDKGTVKIVFPMPNPDVHVKIDGNKIDIAGLEDPLRLAVGEHGLEVTSGEFKSVTQFFTVHRGEQEVVRITLEPTPKTTGPSDRCDLVFDGSGDYIATPFSYGGHSPITVEAVITPYREKGAGCPVGNYQGSGVGLSVGSDGLAHFLFHDSRAYKSAVSDRQVVPFRRVHLAGVYDGKRVLLYVDGQLQKSTSVTEGPHKKCEHPFMIGANPTPRGYPQEFFQGAIHAIRISNAALSEKDFLDAQYMLKRDDTELLYHLDEGEGFWAVDLSGHRYDGRIIDAKWIPAAVGPAANQSSPVSSGAGRARG